MKVEAICSSESLVISLHALWVDLHRPEGAGGGYNSRYSGKSQMLSSSPSWELFSWSQHRDKNFGLVDVGQSGLECMSSLKDLFYIVINLFLVFSFRYL